MAYIKDYVNGIEQDLENVTPKEGHTLVKQSILSQAKRLGEMAEHAYKFHKEGLMEDIEEFAKIQSVNSDGTPMISLSELHTILQKVLR